MIRRSRDAAGISEIYGADCSLFVNDERNIVLVDGQNIGVFVWRGPGVFEGHACFKARGKEAIQIGRAMLEQVPAKMIWGLTPVSLRHVRYFNRKLGFKSGGIMSIPEGEHELFVLEK